MQLKGCTPGDRIPVGLLIQGREGLANGKPRTAKLKDADAEGYRKTPRRAELAG